MAKTPKLKSSAKPSTHSRASRRQSSPSLNLDKSLKALPRPSGVNVLGAHTSAGVSKPSKKKGGKVLKRKQKLRLENGREKAEAVIGKLERKREIATIQREGMKGRNADWDELNEKIEKMTGRKKVKKIKTTKGDDDWEDEPMSVDEEMIVNEKEDEAIPAAGIDADVGLDEEEI